MNLEGIPNFYLHHFICVSKLKKKAAVILKATTYH